MAYMQEPGRAPLKNKNFEALTNGTPLRNGDKDKRFKYDKDGNQIGMQDTATGSYYTPTEEGFAASFAKAEKIGRAPRKFQGQLFTRESGTARGYRTAGGEFLRPKNDSEWSRLQAQYKEDKRRYDSDESRRSARRGTFLDYTGPKTKKTK